MLRLALAVAGIILAAHASIAQPVDLRLRVVEAAPVGGELRVAVEARRDAPATLGSATVDVAYDPALLAAPRFEPGPLGPGYTALASGPFDDGDGPFVRLSVTGEGVGPGGAAGAAVGLDYVSLGVWAFPVSEGGPTDLRVLAPTLSLGLFETASNADGSGRIAEAERGAVEGVTGYPVAAEDAAAPPPATLALAPPAPNPAGARARVAFEVPAPGPARLTVFDVLGREVLTVVDGAVPAGAHEATLETGRLAAGAYVVRLAAGGRVLTRTLTVVR